MLLARFHPILGVCNFVLECLFTQFLLGSVLSLCTLWMVNFNPHWSEKCRISLSMVFPFFPFPRSFLTSFSFFVFVIQHLYRMPELILNPWPCYLHLYLFNFLNNYLHCHKTPLGAAFAKSQKFWYVVFLFLFFKIFTFLLISLFPCSSKRMI